MYTCTLSCLTLDSPSAVGKTILDPLTCTEFTESHCLNLNNLALETVCLVNAYYNSNCCLLHSTCMNVKTNNLSEIARDIDRI